MFKSFVKENRPSLDIDAVATGETWFGEDALERGLCDELRTVDDVLCEFVDEGYNVYSVTYDPTSNDVSPLAGLLPSTNVKSNSEGGVIKGMTKWLVRNVSSAVKEELASELNSTPFVGKGVQERYMMKDPKNVADEIKIEL